MLQNRPAWHIDAKWICALLLLGLLAVTLPAIVSYRLTSKSAATNIIAYTLVGLTSPDGIDSEKGLEEVKQRVIAKGSETVNIAGIPVTFTSTDITTLSPRQLRLKVFGAFAEKFYDLGPKGLAKSQGLDEASVDKFQKDASLINLFSKESHQKVQPIILILILICLLLTGLLVWFSYHVGRFVSPGLVFFLVGLPGLLFFAISSHNSEPVGTARATTEQSPLAMVSTFGAYITPLVMKYFASTYMTFLIIGILLLVVALVVKIVRNHKPITKSNSKYSKAKTT